MATAFDADYGTWQGRIVPLNGPPAAGSFVFELGHALAGIVRTFEPGDHHRVGQVVDATSAKVVSATVVLRGVAATPAGATWEVSLLVDSGVRAVRTVDARARRTLVDFAANVVDLSGSHTLAFQLQVVGGAGPYEAELPGVSIDAVVVDEIGQALAVVNRDPEPGEAAVPVSAAIQFDLENTAGVGGAPDLARTNVYVDGVLACALGTFRPGWTASTQTATVTSGWHFTLVPDVPLNSSVEHTVRVVAAQVGGPAAQLDVTWSFATVDLLAPSVTLAFATTPTELRVVFSEPVLASDPTADGDALNPALYTLAIAVTDAQPAPPLRVRPAVVPAVVSVALETSRSVLLTFDGPATRGALYSFTATGVQDVHGNPSAPPSNSATFEGFLFPVPGDRDFEFYSWFPAEERAADQDADRAFERLSAVVQEPIDLLLYLIDKWVETFDPDTAPEPTLDLMLAELGNPFEFELSVIEKRKLVQLLIVIYRSKGVGPGIVDAVRLFLGVEVTLNVPAWSPVPIGEAILGDDWILGSNDEQDLLTFEVRVPVLLDAGSRKKLGALVDYMAAANELFVIREPGPAPSEPDHWAMDFSRLDTQTTLH